MQIFKLSLCFTYFCYELERPTPNINWYCPVGRCFWSHQISVFYLCYVCNDGISVFLRILRHFYDCLYYGHRIRWTITSGVQWNPILGNVPNKPDCDRMGCHVVAEHSNFAAGSLYSKPDRYVLYEDG